MTNVFYYDFIAKMRRSQAVTGEMGKERRGRGEAGQTANMTASGKRFIIYLSAEIGTEAKQKAAEQEVKLELELETETETEQLLPRVARERLEREGCNRSSGCSYLCLKLLTCQVNAIFMCCHPTKMPNCNPRNPLRTGSSFCLAFPARKTVSAK